MKTILVPLEESQTLPSILETAVLAAKRFGSVLEGLYVRRPPFESIAVGVDGLAGMSSEWVDQLEREENERAERVHERFQRYMEQQGIRVVDALAPSDTPCAAWRAEASPGDIVVGNRGRLFDLIVLGRPARDGGPPRISTLETALFETGRPILIAPPTPPKSIGDTVVISWNGSTETARTIAFGRRYLTGAKKVTVLTIQEGTVAGPSAAEVAAALTLSGVPADARTVSAGSMTVGEATLMEAANLGADLLFKGAYTNSRLRQMIFGGATSHILAAAELPVFMAH